MMSSVLHGVVLSLILHVSICIACYVLGCVLCPTLAVVVLCLVRSVVVQCSVHVVELCLAVYYLVFNTAYCVLTQTALLCPILPVVFYASGCCVFCYMLRHMLLLIACRKSHVVFVLYIYFML